MKYQEFLERTHFTKEELIAFAYGKLVEDAPEEFSRLPAQQQSGQACLLV